MDGTLTVQSHTHTCMQTHVAQSTHLKAHTVHSALRHVCICADTKKKKKKKTEGEHRRKCKGYNFPQSVSAWNKQLGGMCRASPCAGGSAMSVCVRPCLCRPFVSSSSSFLWLGRVVQGQRTANSIIPPPNGPEHALMSRLSHTASQYSLSVTLTAKHKQCVSNWC